MTSDSPPSAQRTSEWDKLDTSAFKYHLSQWQSPKRSTVHFAGFIAKELSGSNKVVDLGCGAGAATAYLAKSSPGCEFLGIDLSAELIDGANQNARHSGISNVSFEADDWFDLRRRTDIDGVISIQTLSWLPEFEWPLQKIFERISPRWISLSSLFYAGDISCRIEVNEHTRDRKSFYNVYSLPAVGRFCAGYGYKLSRFEPFELDIDIPRPENPDLMGTYTVNVVAPGEDADRRRMQISGPLLMNWHAVTIEKV